MEPEVTTTDSPASAAVDGATAEAEVLFGTRSTSDRPHSMSLHRATPVAVPRGQTRGLDLLLGMGIGAAAMYYLDPDSGARRRARVRDRVVRAVTMAPDVLEEAAHEVGAGTSRLLADVRAGRLPATRFGPVRHADWSPTVRLVASALGTALTLFGARRRDALGAAVGVVGSALLARGVATGRPQEARASSGVAPELDAGREIDVAIERPGLPDEV